MFTNNTIRLRRGGVGWGGGGFGRAGHALLWYSCPSRGLSEMLAATHGILSGVPMKSSIWFNGITHFQKIYTTIIPVIGIFKYREILKSP